MTPETTVDAVMSVAIGLGLASACGFRVFVPLLAVSLAGRSGYLPLSPELEWLATTPALIAFATATVLEVVASQVPWLDHALDTIASPAAVIAGTVAAAAAFGDVHPALKWSAALIAGGGAAAAVQGGTVATRAVSGGTTGGLGNPVVATVELIASVVMSILAIVVPILALILTIVVLFFVYRVIRRFLRSRRQQQHAAESSAAPAA